MSFIQPRGKRKYVQAQAQDLYNLEDSIFSNMNSTLDDVNPSQGLNGKSSFFDQESAIKGKEEQKVDSDSDILDYIVKKLETFGYPPRRLNSFKDEFITEKLLPGSARDISLVVPDRYYGNPNKRLSSKDLSGIIEEVQSKFNLVFRDGERKDKKVFLNFNSPAESDGLEGEETMGDDLDEIFGTPSDGPKKKEKTKKMAETQYEMMKRAKSQSFNKITKTNNRG